MEPKQQDQSVSDNAALLVKAASNPSNITDAMLRGWDAALTFFIFPVLMMLRPKYGTMHIHPFNQIMAILTWNCIGMLGLIFSVPFHFRALIGLPTFVAILWGLFICHSWRHRRLMLNMYLEKDSEEEGPPLGFLARLPGGDSWTTMSMAIQPLFVALTSGLLLAVHIINPFVFIYLFAMATALVIRGAVEWFLSWCFIRRQLDSINRMPILQEIIDGKASPQTIGGRPLAGIPVNVPATEKAAIAAKLCGITFQPKETNLAPELQALVSPMEAKPDLQARQRMNPVFNGD